MIVKKEKPYNEYDIGHNALWWFFRKPIKLLKYYSYIRKITDIVCPELNWYMRNNHNINIYNILYILILIKTLTS